MQFLKNIRQHENRIETKAKKRKGNMHVRKEKEKNDKLTCNVRKHVSKQHEREPKPGLYVER